MKMKLAYVLAAVAVAITGCGSEQEQPVEQAPTATQDPATAAAEAACIKRMSDLAEAAKDPVYSEVTTSDHGNGLYYTTGRLQGVFSSTVGAFDYSFNCATTQTGGTYNANLDVDYTSGNP
ncbi:hypothetical protein [Rhodococcus sp. RCBS9]|uniref:hypothetical protein n=1 Tax=Rhodococcus sp. RCBS9 TaxID=3031999 RepID=UPI002402A5EF|nr:hypothetical protein [Rhodococcus sp. RCBS9]WEX03803.1 hypothetical protein P0M12_30065 [Rhodococcus sp. RCBS9]WEX03881.1 hypothetical protein P0M12_00075 [Rhodococcus sp. RCBS9]